MKSDLPFVVLRKVTLTILLMFFVVCAWGLYEAVASGELHMKEIDEVGVLVLATLVLGPYFTIRLGAIGYVLGVLTVWLVPAGVRMVLVYLGDSDYAGFGLGVHLLFGWILGIVYCGGVHLVFTCLRDALSDGGGGQGN